MRDFAFGQETVQVECLCVCVCVYVCVWWAGGSGVGNLGIWVRALKPLEGKEGTCGKSGGTQAVSFPLA